MDTTFRYTVQKPTRHRARVIAEKMIAMYLDGELDEVHIVYTRMVNAATMVAESSQLLPLKKALSTSGTASGRYTSGRD